MSCAECEDFEFRRDHPLRARLLALVPESPVAAAARSMHMTMAMALGGWGGPSHYERHRDAYAQTGDPLELERMLRQVL